MLYNMFYKLCVCKIKFEFLFFVRFFFYWNVGKVLYKFEENVFDSLKVWFFNLDSFDFFFGVVFFCKDNMNYLVLFENKSLLF